MNIINIFFGITVFVSFVLGLLCIIIPVWAVRHIIVPLFGSEESKAHFKNRTGKINKFVRLQAYGTGIIFIAFSVIILFKLLLRLG